MEQKTQVFCLNYAQKFDLWTKIQCNNSYNSFTTSEICWARIFKLLKASGFDSTEAILNRLRRGIASRGGGGGRGSTQERSRFQLKKLLFYRTWMTRFYSWLLLNSMNRFFLSKPVLKYRLLDVESVKFLSISLRTEASWAVQLSMAGARTPYGKINIKK